MSRSRSTRATTRSSCPIGSRSGWARTRRYSYRYAVVIMH
jgi:hypothetical protein